MEKCALLPFFLLGYAALFTCIKVRMVKILTKKKTIAFFFYCQLVNYRAAVKYVPNKADKMQY